MDKKEFDVLVFIGRFQPFHNGHKDVIDHALRISDKVIVLVGSANRPRSTRNPFTYDERKDMIAAHYNYDNDVTIRPLNDITYNDVKWTKQVQEKVANEVLLQIPGNTADVTLSGYHNINVGLIGCKKDGTSYYLNLFPTWKSVEVDYLKEMDGTAIRDVYFRPTYGDPLELPAAPASTAKFLNEFYGSDDFRQLAKEHIYNKNYRTVQTQHAIKDTTADACVIQSGHILIIKRKKEPGKGLWAMPGGHVEEWETFEEAMVRELREETKLKVPEKVVRGSVTKQKTFDDPHRSSRGRVITKAFLIKLVDGPLPRVMGADDAEKARWVPLSDLKPEMMFEDHYDIIQNLIGN